MQRFFQAAVGALCVAALTAVASGSAPNVQLKLSGSIVSFAGGKEIDAPLNRPVHGGEIVRYTILAHNAGGGSAFSLMPVGRVPARTQLYKIGAIPKGTRVAYSLDGTHWVATAAHPDQVRAVRWALAQPLAAKNSVALSYEVRVK